MALLQHLLAQEFKPPPTNHPDPRQGVPRGGATLQVCRKSWATLWREERSRESRSELTTQKPRCDHFPDKCNVYIAALWSTKACGNTPGQLSSEMVHVLLKVLTSQLNRMNDKKICLLGSSASFVYILTVRPWRRVPNWLYLINTVLTSSGLHVKTLQLYSRAVMWGNG